MTLIEGVAVNKLSYPPVGDSAWTTSNGITSAWVYDYWCTLDVQVTYGSANYNAHASSNLYTDLEVETNDLPLESNLKKLLDTLKYYIALADLNEV
jgi:hypothetical protein